MDHNQLAERFRLTRAQSEQLCSPLAIEDYGVQPMEDASPPKWHLAHTTWFFETFVLKQADAGYQPFNEHYEYLFNSYYNGVGEPYPRPQRGFLSRPTVAEVMDYRGHVDQAMRDWLRDATPCELTDVIEIGIHHEQQHQELMVTDLKYNFGHNPLAPRYVAEGCHQTTVSVPAEKFLQFDGGIRTVGQPVEHEGFKFDNECPRHDVLLRPFCLAQCLVSNAEYLDFVRADGYRTPSLWLSEGWQYVVDHGWQHPLYWRCIDGEWYEYRPRWIA